MVYVAFLRGINVGGRVVKMERLRGLFTELGFNNVRSYIQSGNVFFETESADTAAVARSIEDHLQQALGYEVPVFLRTVAELERIIALQPFKDREPTADQRFCVVFTSEAIPRLALPLLLPKGGMEIIQTTEREAFVIWHLINGRPPNSNPLDKILPGKNTTRFFHTAAKILTAAQA